MITRRTALSMMRTSAALGALGIAATASNCSTAPAYAETPDRMLELIKQHRIVGDQLTRLQLGDDDDAIDAFIEAHVEPVREEIAFKRPPVTTEEGAREAIREALSEFTICNQFEKSLLLAALAFLDARVA